MFGSLHQVEDCLDPGNDVWVEHLLVADLVHLVDELLDVFLVALSLENSVYQQDDLVLKTVLELPEWNLRNRIPLALSM